MKCEQKYWFFILLLQSALLGCSDEPQKNPSNNGSSSNNGENSFVDAGADASLGCESSIYCGESGFMCGVHTVAACGEVDCGACRYEQVTAVGGKLVSGPGGRVHLLRVHEGSVEYADVTAPGWQAEVVGDGLTGERLSMAVGADGTVNVVMFSDGIQHGTKAPGGDWRFHQVTADEGTPAIALDGQGQAQILVWAENSQTRANELRRYINTGEGIYETFLVEGFRPYSAPVVAQAGDGSFSVGFLNDPSGVEVFDFVNGALVQDESFPDLGRLIGGISMARQDGKLKVLVLTGERTLRTGSQLTLWTREGGAWSSEEITTGTSRDLAVAFGPRGEVHLAYHARNGVRYTRPGSTQSLTLRPECEEGTLSMAVDGHDQAHVLVACDRGQEPLYMRPVERYSDAYLAGCELSAELICAQACECGSPDCCYGAEDDGFNGCKFGPGDSGRQLCVADFRQWLCGNLTVESAPLIACADALESEALSCMAGRAVVPTICADVVRLNQTW